MVCTVFHFLEMRKFPVWSNATWLTVFNIWMDEYMTKRDQWANVSLSGIKAQRITNHMIRPLRQCMDILAKGSLSEADLRWLQHRLALSSYMI
jgi:hypothetical protein